MNACDEPVEDSYGAGDLSVQTEGQPDVIPVIKSISQSDQRVTVTRQEVLTLTNMLEKIRRKFFHIEEARLTVNFL